MLSNHLLERLQVHLKDNTLYYAVLSSPRLRDSSVSKITVRPLNGSKGLYYQITRQCTPKAVHANVLPGELLEIVWPLLANDFAQAVFFTAEADFHALISKKGKWTILQKRPTRVPSDQPHNRLKKYILEPSTPISFLVELGITRADGTLVPKMAHKYKQINRFVEIVADIASHLSPGKVLNIVDFGCGKSYLTFALYHYFHYILRRQVSITGLDLKADVIAHCQQLADALGYADLRFQVGNIHDHQPADKIDLVVSLHACDTATDAALAKAVKWQADVILCVPCCQHELYEQMQDKRLEPILKHGILRERFAALATDAARAQLLEMAGYNTQVMEFIDLEHTPKNLLIRAVSGGKRQGAAQYRDFVRSLAIAPTLENLLSEHIDSSSS